MNDLPQRRTFLPQRPRPLRLSHVLMPLAEEARARIDRVLGDGCPCKSQRATLVRRKIGGTWVPQVQCDGCGKAVSGQMSPKGHPNLSSYSEWNDEKRDAYWATRRDQNERKRLGLIADVADEAHALRDAYNRFLQGSPDWPLVCQGVMERAADWCEACRSEPAVVVHHKTYAFGFLPPAWELQAVCDACHRRLHADKLGQQDEWCPASLQGAKS